VIRGRALFLGLTLAFGLVALPALAADKPAETVLKEIIEAEFDGDVMARRDKVAYTSGKTPAAGDCSCALRRDSWDLDEELMVVSSWEFDGLRMLSHSKATARVRFHVIATATKPPKTSSNGPLGRLQRITLPAEPFDETVNYRIRLRDGQWRLVDPPRPRVGITPLLARLHGALAFRTDEAARARQQNDPQREKMAQIYSHYLEFQIAELDYAALTRP
jgi:hypothetical protein